MKKSTHLKTWLVLALVILLAGNLLAGVSTVERAALIALYNSTGGDNWTQHGGWKQGALEADGFAAFGMEEQWFGVSAALGYVQAISIGNNNLSGTIPSELENLTQITSLRLYSNDNLTGSIPAELGTLVNLTNIELCNNNLSGSIPAELGNLSNLERLRLDDNNLSGSIPAALGNLGHLETMMLQQNELTDSIPPELANLSSLKEVWLSYNQLSGTIPVALANLSNLETLKLYKNQLTGSIPVELGTMSSLQDLSVSYNQLSGTIPVALANLSNLRGLDLAENELTGTIPVELANLSNLEYLDLGKNHLSGSIPSALGYLSHLEYFHLAANMLSGSIPTELTNLTNTSALYGIDLDYNALFTDDANLIAFLNTKDEQWDRTQTVVPDDITATGTGTDEITVSWTRILYGGAGGYHVYYTPTSGGPYTLAGTTTTKNVNSLVVSGLTADMPYYFVVQTQTNSNTYNNDNTVLSDSSSEVSGEIFTDRGVLIALYNSTNGDSWSDNSGWKTTPLEADGFATRGTEGTWHGVTVAEINGIDQVTQIDLASNGLTGSIPAALGSVSNLTALWLQDNALGGSIPTELGNLSNLQELYLNSNVLSGSIPTQLGNLSNLQSLYLYNNELSGSIPTQLGNLNNLTELYIEYNQLSGSIPAELGRLSNLLDFYLTGNKLSGSIPTELTTLSSLSTINIDYNALYTDDATLRSFLTGKDPDWESTQTVLPADITATVTGTDEITISWTPIVYTGDTGGYRVYYSSTSGGAYTLGGTTANKSANSLAVTGLTAEIPYYFVVQTQTDPHGDNSNTVLSDSSGEVSGEIITERGALIALYNSTNGDSWTNNSGWKQLPLEADGFSLQGTEGSWRGITVAEVNGSDHVTQIDLHANNLNGTIPAKLGNLSYLVELHLHANNLSGSIPSALGNAGSSLSGLLNLRLHSNQLSGSIPAAMGNLSQLQTLRLDENRLSGSIPAELGYMSELVQFYLNGNALTGLIPTQLVNMTSLSMVNLGYNGLYTDDATLRSFLTGIDPDWESTQTVAPAGLSAIFTGATEITVSWTPIAFTSVTGFYEVYLGTTAGGPYNLLGVTANINADTYTVFGANSDTQYYFVIRTKINLHTDNDNVVTSDYSAEVESMFSQDDTKMLAAPLAGVPGTTVQFANTCGGKVNRFLWNFGDGSFEGYRHETKPDEKVHPSHTYADANDFTVSLITTGWESASKDTLLLPNLIAIDPNYAPLAVVAGSETHDGYGWAKTIDHDVFSIDGKMTADLADVECVYSFSDSSVRNVSRVRLFIDDVYQTNYPGHLTNKFEVLVSVDNVSWTSALATSIPWEYRGQFADFTFAPVLGRYVKLKLTESHNSNAKIIQLTEFQVFGATGEDTTLEKGLLADNSPVTEYKLAQNYPNPFNPTTTINFALPETADVSLQVYNVAGQMVAELVKGHQDAGRHQVVFDAASLSSGVYFCVMRAANMEQVTRMILMK